MTPADRFLLDNDTAWWVIGDLDAFHDYEYLDLERPCESWRPVCNRIGPNFGKPDHNGCSDCGSTGRHTFDIEVECPTCTGRAEWCGFDGIGNPACSNGVTTYRVSIVPGTVLLIADRDDLSPTALIFINESGNAYLYDPSERINLPVFLPSAAAPGMWAVKLKVST